MIEILPVPRTTFGASAKDLTVKDLVLLIQHAQFTWQHIHERKRREIAPWAKYPTAVCVYGQYLAAELRGRDAWPGYQGAWQWFHERRLEAIREKPTFRKQVPMPSWMGDEEYHRFFRQCLIWHDPYYLEVWPDEPEPFEVPEAPWDT